MDTKKVEVQQMDAKIKTEKPDAEKKSSEGTDTKKTETTKKVVRERRRNHQEASLAVRAMQIAGTAVAMITKGSFALVSWFLSLFVLYLVVGSIVFGGIFNLTKVGLVSDYLPSNQSTTPKFAFQNARPLAQKQVGDITKLCLLVDEGTPGQAIKYLDVAPEVNALAERESVPHIPYIIEIPDIPAGDWTFGTVTLSSDEKHVQITDKTDDPLPGVERSWHRDSYNYLDLTIHPMEGGNDHVKLVSHPSLNTPRNLAVMKYAIFDDDMPSIEKETAIYKRLKDFRAAPRFLGHVTENGRIIGFLIEYIESARPASKKAGFSDLAREKCKAALVELHKNRKIIHNDAYPDNCLIRRCGAPVWIDFNKAKIGAKKSDPGFQKDLTLLDSVRVDI